MLRIQIREKAAIFFCIFRLYVVFNFPQNLRYGEFSFEQRSPEVFAVFFFPVLPVQQSTRMRYPQCHKKFCSKMPKPSSAPPHNPFTSRTAASKSLPGLQYRHIQYPVLLHILYNWFSRFLGKTPTLNMIEFVLSKCSTWGLLFFLPKLANFAPSSSLCLSLEDKELLPITEFSSPPPFFTGQSTNENPTFFPAFRLKGKGFLV